MRGTHGRRRGVVPFALTRRLVLAAVAISLSLAGHASGRGALPGFVGLLLVGAVAGALTVVATARTRSFTWLLMYLLGSQLLIHMILVLEVPHAHGMAPMPLIPTGSMAVSHLLASFLAAAVLARGERILVAWTRLTMSSLGWRLPVVTAPAGIRLVPISDFWWAPTAQIRVTDRSRRGPPAMVCA